MVLAQMTSTAHDHQGFYARLDTGWSVTRNAKATGATISGEVNDLHDAPVIGGGLGYRFNRYFRTDITTTYTSRYNLDDQDRAGTTWRSDIEAWTTMLNAYAEYPVGDFSPYLMAGAGVSRNEMGQTTDSAGTTTIGSNTETSFAWQTGAGVGYSVSPEWVLDLGYRYLDAGKFKSATPATGNAVEGDLRSHIAMLGVRYNFGTSPIRPAAAAVPPAMPATPPPQMPAAAPPPPTMSPPVPTGPELPVTYMVFFDFDRSEITTGSERVIREAAGTATKAPVTRIVTTGHADRVGSDGYNMALSLRRAHAVRDILMREGVPERQIVIVAKGEREPLVATADGTKEPRNRRVEIVVQ